MTDKPNLHQRLHAAMGDISYIQKEKKQGMRYTIVSHDAVTAKVRPVLVKHGIVYYPIDLTVKQNGNRTEVCLIVRFVNVDDPVDYIDVATLGYGVDEQDKGPGKAISYAVKYALLKTLGLETGDDPDYEDKPHEPEPAFDEQGMLSLIAAQPNPQSLERLYRNNRSTLEDLLPEQKARVLKAFSVRKAQLLDPLPE